MRPIATVLFLCWFGLVASCFISASLKVFSQCNLRRSLQGPQSSMTGNTLTHAQCSVLSLILFVNCNVFYKTEVWIFYGQYILIIQWKYTRVSQMKAWSIFYLVIYSTQNDILFLHSLHCFHTSVQHFESAWIPSEKSLLANSAATRAPPAAPLHRTCEACLPSPLWVVQKRENRLG